MSRVIRLICFTISRGQCNCFFFNYRDCFAIFFLLRLFIVMICCAFRNRFEMILEKMKNIIGGDRKIMQFFTSFCFGEKLCWRSTNLKESQTKWNIKCRRLICVLFPSSFRLSGYKWINVLKDHEQKDKKLLKNVYQGDILRMKWILFISLVSPSKRDFSKEFHVSWTRKFKSFRRMKLKSISASVESKWNCDQIFAKRMRVFKGALNENFKKKIEWFISLWEDLRKIGCWGKLDELFFSFSKN